MSVPLTPPPDPVSGRTLQRSMNVSIASGAAGTLWVIVCSPQAIFNVFLRNHLGATSAQLGLLVGILSLASILQLPSIIIYSRLRSRKLFWILTSVVHRLNGPVLAAVAFGVARGLDRSTGLTVIFGAMVVSWVVTNLSSSGWWSWMADLVPLSVRARFFGRRSAAAQIVNIIGFFTVSVALDAAASAPFVVYGVIFLIGAVGGVVDILLHVLVPDIPSVREPLLVSDFFAPLRERNFRRFSLITGMTLFSINVSAPFFAPYITSPEAIGAPTTWLGIMFVISQLTWIAVSPAWGTVMDQYGRKPVVMIGLLFTASWVGYLVLSPGNYTFVLPAIALVGGVFAPAFWDGINQLMLSLTPERHRLSYIAWYWTIIGLVSAGGSYLGGILDDRFRGARLDLRVFEVGGFQVVVLASLLLVVVSLLTMSRITEGKEKPMSYVFSRVANPGIFRTFMNIGVLSAPSDSQRVARTLRFIDAASDDLAVEHIIERAFDPDGEVREEAVRALGRLRPAAALDALTELLSNPDSSTRVQAARALGRIGDPRAVSALVDSLETGSDEVREACAEALGEIGGDESVQLLLKLIREDESDRVFAGGAAAVSRHGAFEAAWEIVPRLHRTRNPVLRNQLAIALGNILGRPGEFYRYVTGSQAQRDQRIATLIQDSTKALSTLFPSITSQRLADCIGEIDGGEYSAVLRGLRELARTSFAAEEQSESDLIDALYATDPRVGLWYWFLAESSRLEGPPEEEETRRIELLLVLYGAAAIARRRGRR